MPNMSNPCRPARDPEIRPADSLGSGDRIVLLAGAARVTVLEAVHDAETGETSLRLDPPVGEAAEPCRLPSDTLLDVLSAPPPPQPDFIAEHDVTVTVTLTVSEQVTYEFTADVEIPAAVAADPEQLHDHLAENEELWLDELNPLQHTAYINERCLDEASVVLAA
ncbi:hypothetical protein AB0E82_39565 [Streptomyces anulatus]|uniref:hypothetical protein n=1 Tax=Streptomyces anulatus TaxID=1892 RepID=UPI00341077AC